MEEKKNKNKGLIVAIIFLAIIALAGIGYFVYDNYFRLEEKDVETEKVPQNSQQLNEQESENSKVKYLLDNQYLEKIDSSTQRYRVDSTIVENHDKIMEILDGKVYVLKDIMSAENDDDVIQGEMIVANGISGTPKNVFVTFYQSLQGSQFFVLTEEGDLFYSYIILPDEEGVPCYLSDFKKINNEKIVAIYDIKDKLYENMEGTSLRYNSIYAETDNGSLLLVSNGLFGNEFEQDFPNLIQW